MSSPINAVVAMDWGGTWIRVAVVDRGGSVIWEDRVPSPKGGTQSQLLDAAGAMLARGFEQGQPMGLGGLGIAIAGPVDADTGMMFHPPNLPSLHGISVKAYFEAEFGCTAWIGNDANLAALGEYRYGAGKDAREQGRPSTTLAYVTVSTGIGGGVVDRGRMFLGVNGLATEVGHMSIDVSREATPCPCGSRGCLEALASGASIARIARRRVSQLPAPSSALSAMDQGTVTSEVVFQLAAAGDSLARNIVEDVLQALGVGLTNVLHLYNPDLVVLGGGVSVGLEQLELLPRIEEIMTSRAMSEKHKEFRLVASSLGGDRAGIIGAAALAWDSLEQHAC